MARATDTTRASQVKEIIQRRICFEFFWCGDGRFGGTEAKRTWPIEMVIEPDGRFLALVAAKGPGFIPSDPPWKFFYFGWVKNGCFYLGDTWS